MTVGSVSDARIGALLWVIFIISWYAAMVWRAPARKEGSRSSAIRDILFYAIGFLLLFNPQALSVVLWASTGYLGLLLLALELLFFAFAWWARISLGRLWSGTITLRENHVIIQDGPYRRVRHPIYTGFIGAAWSYALLTASPASLLGAALLTAQMAWKAKREEQFLRAELGSAAYDLYAASTPMLIPFI